MKFPRTPHLPGSTATADDLWSTMVPQGTYLSTEKMDGSNIMMNRDKFITRKGGVSSADWAYPARHIHQEVSHLIPKGIWLAGELLTWRKSIPYEELPGEYMIFGAMKGNQCLPWEDVVDIADGCGIPPVRVLARGDFTEVVEESRRLLNESMEGFVVRPTGRFQLPHYGEHVAKFVGDWHQSVATSTGRNGIR